MTNVLASSSIQILPKSEHPVRQKIRRYTRLKPGWNFGEGEALSAGTIHTALDLHSLLTDAGYLETDAFPGIDGEILVKGYGELHRIELFAEADGSITFAVSRDGEFLVHEEGLGLAECKERMGEFLKPRWTTCESSTQSIICVSAMADLPVAPLEAAKDFRFFPKTVPCQLVGLFATT